MIRKQTDCTNLSANDTVEVYPSFGHLTADGRSWRIVVRGTVYESDSISIRKKLLLRLLQRVAKVRPSEAQRDLFERRVQAFIAPTERGKRVAVRVGDSVFRIQKKTKRNGRFAGTVRLTAHDVQHLRESGELDDGWLKLRIVAPNGDNRADSGRVRLIETNGLSVISDIDDTIKITDVHSRRALLENTFLREFQPIEGMAERYRQWATEGVDFHYVSSSPWQLFNPLAELFQESGFPPGTFHLRSFRLREQMLRRLRLIRRHGKTVALRDLLTKFPQRQFVLIGDSGEKDPEIYGALAREFPRQVQAIYIRNMPQRPIHVERRLRAFRQLHGRVPCRTFDTPGDLPVTLTQGF